MYKDEVTLPSCVPRGEYFPTQTTRGLTQNNPLFPGMWYSIALEEAGGVLSPLTPWMRCLEYLNDFRAWKASDNISYSMYGFSCVFNEYPLLRSRPLNQFVIMCSWPHWQLADSVPVDMINSLTNAFFGENNKWFEFDDYIYITNSPKFKGWGPVNYKEEDGSTMDTYRYRILRPSDELWNNMAAFSMIMKLVRGASEWFKEVVPFDITMEEFLERLSTTPESQQGRWTRYGVLRKQQELDCSDQDDNFRENILEPWGTHRYPAPYASDMEEVGDYYLSTLRLDDAPNWWSPDCIHESGIESYCGEVA